MPETILGAGGADHDTANTPGWDLLQEENDTDPNTQPSVDFTAIDDSFDLYRLRYILESPASGGNLSTNIRINNDSSGNYNTDNSQGANQFEFALSNRDAEGIAYGAFLITNPNLSPGGKTTIGRLFGTGSDGSLFIFGHHSGDLTPFSQVNIIPVSFSANGLVDAVLEAGNIPDLAVPSTI